MTNEQDILRKYMKEASSHALLTPEEEKELADVIQTCPDEKTSLIARNKLIESNLLLVVNIALKIYKRFGFLRNSDLTIMDLVQFGNTALIDCANGFKSERGVKFSTYAYITIERRIYVGINDHRFFHMPQEHKIIASKIEELKLVHGDSLTDEKILEHLKISEQVLQRFRENDELKLVSVDDINLLLERIEDKGNESFIQGINRQELKEYLLNKMDDLEPKEKRIIQLMFFDGKETSMAAVAKIIGISRERVRVVLDKTLDRLRKRISQENNVGFSEEIKRKNRELGEREEYKKDKKARKKRNLVCIKIEEQLKEEVKNEHIS